MFLFPTTNVTRDAPTVPLQNWLKQTKKSGVQKKKKNSPNSDPIQ